MTLLLAGFDADVTERLSAALREAGHRVLGATGAEAARTLASSTRPVAILTPPGETGEAMREALAEHIAPDGSARPLEVRADEDVPTILRRIGGEPAARTAPADSGTPAGSGTPPAPGDAASGAAPEPTGGASRPGPSEGRARSSARAIGGESAPQKPAEGDEAPGGSAWTAVAMEDDDPKTRPARASPSFEALRRSEGAGEPSAASSRVPPASGRSSAGIRPQSPGEEGVPPSRPPEAPASAASRGAREPAEPEASGATAEASRERLDAKLAEVRFRDYHRMLEVEPGATAYVVREQYRRLVRRYRPSGWPGRLDPEDLDKLEEIAAGLEDAREVLGEPDLRARYERALQRRASS